MPENTPLDAKGIASSKAPALLVLAMLRDDGLAMQSSVEYLREHLTPWEIIETITYELTGVFLHSHNGNVDAAEKALQDTLVKISSSATD
ncbi:hypothetical protein CGLAR1_09790 [Corynebacterium glutamicum]|uniref:hypothetical protein n=1 Tax=Corynebacterium glutamicum TaxID=1718 RepID=UPI0004F7DA6A|nr:hypothetical protein [Corynebacterium glutamicum]AIK85531.1 hypothetical protein CGLAR1_09790 [Corynebacterium glutamicum]AIK88316.1 hypothetical protein AR0_09940 [Corynebacterium glutamicum]